MNSTASTAIFHRQLFPTTSLPPATDNAPRYTIDFRSSDQTLDRYQEVITVAGWKLENYRKNPVFQNAHSYWSLADTIGKALITEVRSLSTDATEDRARCPHRAVSEGSETSRRAGDSAPYLEGDGPARHSLGDGGAYLFQRIQFAVEENPMAKLAYGLYKGGFLKAVSVGFIPLRWENGSQEAGYRRKYLEQELLEVSAVSIPANPNALTLGLQAGAIEKSDVKELMELLQSICGRMGSRENGENGGKNFAAETCLPKELLEQVNQIRAVLKCA